jgi:effector-binding domain-containing protein
MTCLRSTALAAIAAVAVTLSATIGLAQGAPPSSAGPPSQPGLAQPSDAFGEEVTLMPKTIIYLKGTATWDSAFETLVDSFKSIYELIGKQGLKASGPAMTIYTSTDDTGFQFQAAVPVENAPKDLPQGDIAVGTSPEGRALKFVHRGSYDAMDTTYDAITNFLDERKLDANDLFIEQYVTDVLTTPQDKLVIEVYVPIK